MKNKKTDRLLEDLIVAQSANSQSCVSTDDIAKIAEKLGVTTAQVLDTASFYKDLSLHPRGTHVIRLCKSPCCWLQGGREIAEILQKTLNIQMGETTADGQFTLEFCGCIGACDQSPAMMIDEEIIGNLSPARVAEALCRYREAEV